VKLVPIRSPLPQPASATPASIGAHSCDSSGLGALGVRKIVGVAFAIERGSKRLPLP